MEPVGGLDVAQVAKIERLALHAWPAWEVEDADSWLLRHAVGITRRANSVWPNELRNKVEIEALLARVEKFYHERNLPVRFQICPAAQPPNLDEFLAHHDYRAVARTAVQTTSMAELVPHVAVNPEFTVEISEKATAKWWVCYALAEGVGEESITAHMKICEGIQVATAYVLVMRDGVAIAVGSAAYEDGWIGFFNVATLRQHRRQGAAATLMAALVRWGVKQGASMAYLQVMADNQAALKLYGHVDFKVGYYYHYREEVLSASKD